MKTTYTIELLEYEIEGFGYLWLARTFYLSNLTLKQCKSTLRNIQHTIDIKHCKVFKMMGMNRLMEVSVENFLKGDA